jgi:hypothetical protein
LSDWREDRWLFSFFEKSKKMIFERITHGVEMIDPLLNIIKKKIHPYIQN